MADETTNKNMSGAPDSGAVPGNEVADPAIGSGAVPLPEEDRTGGERVDRGIADFVRRAVSAGVGAAARSKEDIVRVAATEVRGWLDHLNLDEEIAKALSKMVIEVKTEVRFRATEDGKLVPEATNEMKVKVPGPR